LDKEGRRFIGRFDEGDCPAYEEGKEEHLSDPSFVSRIIPFIESFNEPSTFIVKISLFGRF
jgi:hypothetical protein